MEKKRDNTNEYDRLLIDLGNTACKVAFATNTEMGACVRSGDGEDPHSFLMSVFGDRIFDVVAFSSVQRHDPALEAWLRARCRKLIVVDGDTPTELKIDYQTSDRLGGDLLAAGLGAITRFPKRDVVIIHFGTAIAVEEINKEGWFVGLAISPGLQMRLRALHQYTGMLPLVVFDQDDQIPEVGIDTRGAIMAGVVQGIVYELEGYVAKNQDKKIILTGGDALFFAKKLKTPIFVDYNLIFIGLAEIAKRYAE